MAFLIPKNLASSSEVPKAFRDVARRFRDLVDEDVTVWFDRSLGGPDDDSSDRRPCLVVLDPAAGVLLFHVVKGGTRGLERSREDLSRKIGLEELAARLDDFAEKIKARHSELCRSSGGSDASGGSGEAHGEDKAGPAVVTSAVLLSAERAKVADADRYLLAEDFVEERLRAALARIVAAGSAGGSHTVGDERVVRAAIYPELMIRRAPEDGQGLLFRPPEHGDGSVAVLDREQERLARGLGSGYRAIKGVAGSGKTLVLKFRAEHLARHFRQHRILLTCFNRLLADALSHELSEFPNVKVATVDSLAFSVCQSAEVDLPPDVDKYSFRREAAIRALSSGDIPDDERYHYVLVDEVQDLDNAGLQVAHGMLRAGYDDFVVAADEAQRIYRRELISWTPPGTNGRGRTTILDRNYRNTWEILTLAHDFLTVGETEAADSDAVLNREQERLARRLGSGYRVIKGVAGSGKTLVLKFRAEHLARQFRQHRILLTCFNRLLADALSHELSELPNVKVATVDSLAFSVCQSAEVDLPPDVDEYSFRREAAIRALSSGDIPDDERYHYVLVDEVQDLDNAGLQVAHGMLRAGYDDFVVAADDTQRIYQRGLISWTPPGTSGRGRTTILDRNYRNTWEILKLAREFLTVGETGAADSDAEDLNSEDLNVVVPPRAATRSGERPRVKTFGSADEAVDVICRGLRWANDRGTAWSDMCVMLGNRDLRRQMRTKAGDHGIPFVDVAEQSAGSYPKDSYTRGRPGSKADRKADRVCVSTLQKVKGLEFSRVYIAGVNDVYAGPDADDETKRRLLYVGMTRATDCLRIAMHGDGPLVDSLNAAYARL